MPILTQSLLLLSISYFDGFNIIKEIRPHIVRTFYDKKKAAEVEY